MATQKRKSNSGSKDRDVKKSRSMEEFLAKGGSDSVLDSAKQCVQLLENWMPGTQMVCGEFCILSLACFVEAREDQ